MRHTLDKQISPLLLVFYSGRKTKVANLDNCGATSIFYFRSRRSGYRSTIASYVYFRRSSAVHRRDATPVFSTTKEEKKRKKNRNILAKETRARELDLRTHVCVRGIVWLSAWPSRTKDKRVTKNHPLFSSATRPNVQFLMQIHRDPGYRLFETTTPLAKRPKRK